MEQTMGNYTQLVFSDNPIAQDNLNPNDPDLYIKSIFPLFWFALFTPQNIKILSENEHTYTWHHLVVERAQAISNFQSKTHLWSAFGLTAQRLAREFINDLTERDQKYIILYVSDIFSIGHSEEDDEAILKILACYELTRSTDFLAAVQQNIWLSLSYDYYFKEKYNFALNGLDSDEPDEHLSYIVDGAEELLDTLHIITNSLESHDQKDSTADDSQKPAKQQHLPPTNLWEKFKKFLNVLF